MRYISLFTGAGGLESATEHPLLCCEIDAACWPVLRKRFPGVQIYADVRTLEPPPADVVVGGWPCQDISVAGLQRGLGGQRSGLFFEMLRIAHGAQADTIVAENVPNLLVLERGRAFQLVLEAFRSAGFSFIAWRTINAREFGLPHNRARVFVIASRLRDVALALHRPYEHEPADMEPTESSCNGFYWTAGLQSICYSIGNVPALKVGSGLSIASPPAIHFEECVRKATPQECLKLQGFEPSDFEGVGANDVYRMAGNAVAVPVGRFVLASVGFPDPKDPFFSAFGRVAHDGFFDGEVLRVVHHTSYPKAANLHQFIDRQNRTNLSPRAAAGFVGRLRRSGKPCPPDLLELLVTCAGELLEAPSTESRVTESETEHPRPATEVVGAPGSNLDFLAPRPDSQLP